MAKIKVLNLKAEDKQKLVHLSKSGTLKSRELNRCRILLLASQGKFKRNEIANILNMSLGPVIEVCKRYQSGGLDNALYEKPRSGAPSIFTGKQKAKITALACTKAPEGYARWSLRLLADKAVELDIVEKISYKTVEAVLKKRT